MTRHKADEKFQGLFARRLQNAIDLCPHAPPKHQGERVWLAEQLTRRGKGVTTETIRKWLNGENTPSNDKVGVIADILGVDSHWLVYGDDASDRANDAQVFHSIENAAANIVSGFIQMDGAKVVLPANNAGENIDLYAVIDRVSFPLHITVGEQQDGKMQFLVPISFEDVFVIALVRREGEYAFDVFQIEDENLENVQLVRGRRLVTVDESDLKPITSFAERL